MQSFEHKACGIADANANQAFQFYCAARAPLLIGAMHHSLQGAHRVGSITL
jgi:hypothetical protein